MTSLWQTAQRPSVGRWFENKEFSTEDGNGTIANTFHMFVDREPRFYANIHFPNQRVSYAYPNEGDSYQDSDGYGIVDYWYKGLSAMDRLLVIKIQPVFPFVKAFRLITAQVKKRLKTHGT